LQRFALVKKNNNRRRHVQVVGAKVTQEFIEKENEREKEKERNLFKV
jgi:hypothetical protein